MKHLITLKDFSEEEINEIIDKAIEIKNNKEDYAQVLAGKTLAMLFQKTSTRTRCSFEAGMTQLGGHGMFLDWRTTNFTLGSLADEIKSLSRYADIIMARVYKHEDVATMAEASSVPVINGLCDMYHPCQALADLMTIKEKKGKLKGLTLTFVGDGNNVCHSLMIAGTKVGMKVKVATPKDYEPKGEIVEYTKKFGDVLVTHDPKEACKDADVVYTDTWVSMGQEEETEKRKKVFPPFQVTSELLGNALFMHCLPAHRGYEMTDDVIDSPNSVVFDEAENRMHAQKAVILKLLGLF